mmetsp:Transcript_23191/g.39752  ORF Transcript_23191/g.39752 Transcript_23191/m.39752 type:complete len:178 (+) Transcript_23191:1990-2523(+)
MWPSQCLRPLICFGILKAATCPAALTIQFNQSPLFFIGKWTTFMFEPRDKCLTSDNSSEIALICMPWASIAQPSLALGLIKAQLAEAGIASDAFYFNLELADLIGLDLYDATKNRNVMASEWVFAEGLPKEEPSEDYLAYLAERGTSSEEIDIWRLIRGEAEAFFSALPRSSRLEPL